jgi:hypothetical protein
VLTVNVEVADPLPVTATLAGLNEHVGAGAEAGDTEQLNATVPVNPPVGSTVTVAVADWPGITELGVSDDGAETVKSGGSGFTVRVGLTLNCSLPDVPVIASV